MKPRHLRLPLLAALCAVSGFAAFEAGKFAYTKRLETNLLAEPKPLAAASGKIAFGHKVKVEEVAGAWVRVSEGATAGWVFGGNLTETKPDEGTKFDNVAVLASKTTATAAARPLEEDVAKYAEQRNLQPAGADLDWMQKAAATVTEDDITTFLKDHKMGEYQ